jgi:CheY-like chemotaxis protein
VRVLLVNDRRSERDSLVKVLAQASYQVEAVPDETSAVAAMKREPAQVIVLAPPPRGGDELVRRLRGFDASGQAYFLTILDGITPHKELAQLLDAGVNDFVRRPLLDGDFLERVKAPVRLLRWVKSVERPLAFDFSVPSDVAKLQAWKRLGLEAAEDLGLVVGQPLAVTAGMPLGFAPGARAATIPLSLAENQVEVRVTIAADAAAFQWLKSAVVGDAGATDAMADDVVRELANTAGGVLKRSALSENVTLTMGLPASEPLSITPNQSAWTLALPEAAGRLAVVGALQSKANLRVVATNLSEGMVVAHDICNAGGILLVPAGSRLTSSSAAKLAKVLGPRVFLEVAPAA